MSQPFGPASLASTSCWSSRAVSTAGWAAPASMSAAFRRRPSSMRPTAYERAAEQAKSAPFGLRVEHPTIDFARTIEWKNGIVGRLTSGVGALLKRHRVKILQGRAVMVDGKTCRVETDTGPQVVSAEHVVLATGSVPTTLPALPFGGRVI